MFHFASSLLNSPLIPLYFYSNPMCTRHTFYGLVSRLLVLENWQFQLGSRVCPHIYLAQSMFTMRWRGFGFVREERSSNWHGHAKFEPQSDLLGLPKEYRTSSLSSACLCNYSRYSTSSFPFGYLNSCLQFNSYRRYAIKVRIK